MKYVLTAADQTRNRGFPGPYTGEEASILQTTDYTEAITKAKEVAEYPVNGTVYIWVLREPKSNRPWRLVTWIRPDGNEWFNRLEVVK